MPRVGSSKITTFGAIDSHFASTTFCWLPPDRVPTSVSMEAVRMSSAALRSVALRRSAPVRISRCQAKAARLASEMFSFTEDSSTSPDRLRSSGTRKMPWSMASRGARMATARPSRRTSPPTGRSTPKMAQASSVRPAPTRPAMPRISPPCRARSIGVRGVRLCPQARDLEYRTGGRASGRDIERFQVAADHHADHGVVPDRALRQLTHDSAVAQHHDPVGAVLDLVQAVRDEDDGHAARS